MSFSLCQTKFMMARLVGSALVCVSATLLVLPVGAAPAGQRQISLPAGIVPVDGEYRCNKDDMPMVLVPAGEFVMGSSNGSYDERPVHKVYLDAFLADKHEVTNAQFARFVSLSGYRPQGPWRRAFVAGCADQPVRFVTWYDAQAYARWAGRQLPSEAQWEKAAAGPSGLTYPWGKQWQDRLSCVGRVAPEQKAITVDQSLPFVPNQLRSNTTSRYAGPVAVGSFPKGASSYGCLDMAGNVWEWVADWYDRYFYVNLTGVARNPTGPSDGAAPEQRFVKTGTAAGNERSTRKAIRGGSFTSRPDDARCARRMWGNPRYWFNDTGFRCAVVLDGKKGPGGN